MDREAMFAREEEAWGAFADALAAVPEDRREAQGVVPGWSAHDLLWHCAYWTDFTGGVLERIRRGDPDPESGDEPEAQILAAGREASWEDAMARAERGRLRVRDALAAFDGEAPALAVKWFQEDTSDHYDEHAAQVRGFIS